MWSRFYFSVIFSFTNVDCYFLNEILFFNLSNFLKKTFSSNITKFKSIGVYYSNKFELQF
jgi:hypothetical protein